MDDSPDTPLLLEIQQLRTPQIGPLDLSLHAGEVVQVAGPSGAGKSLLLRAITDLDRNEGQIRLEGHPRHTFSGAGWRRRVGYLPADPAWWADTVGEHLQSGDEHWLEALGFTPDVRTWTVDRLSSGERQRLALVRVLQNRPRVLLLDEPTANLDPDNTRTMERLIRDYLRESDAAALWVSHDADQRSRLGGRLFTMENGRLTESNG
ncbi:ABC transporter ATP-binding protein [Ectothiorhodospira lacustris]|uniref:ABC transporter ATP-binding protein n=1 Tax=Ectothiorhodospira lacustris TaxID=2899127 RepID=UPI001EE97DAB|nr:ATP-binding cassette domain-containing protein [Ectothiorhodospira lacustris]MCG5501633.1 ATP-binding cassette domain-containing protein [Ectothiorhodospira lacustris]MCG5510735.1 ATP-binding cassette domain-containing protein [Ectothiorhodospira lacustris]MCG5522467.1 ATP-binding cassette domain-containing protein [Ectothiorhodospira lacustris]